jgi:hypothetical protein
MDRRQLRASRRPKDRWRSSRIWGREAIHAIRAKTFLPRMRRASRVLPKGPSHSIEQVELRKL